MLQNFFVGPALIGHDCRTDLAQADAMPPSRAGQHEAPRFFIDDERRAVKTSTRLSATDLQFLADEEVVALAAQLQPVDSAGWAASQRLDVANWTQIHAEARLDEVGEFIRSVLDAPTIEIASFPVEAGKDSRKEIGVAGVAVSRRI